jgi:hypothetical protein
MCQGRAPKHGRRAVTFANMAKDPLRIMIMWIPGGLKGYSRR